MTPPHGSQHLVGIQSAFTTMPADNEKAVMIATRLLKHKNRQTVQTLKNLLTFIPNPNHVKDVLTTAVIKLVHDCPQAAFWLFQHPDVLEPEVHVREIIVQELTNQFYAWGYTPEDFCFTADQHLEISEATQFSLLAHQPNSVDSATFTLIQVLLIQQFEGTSKNCLIANEQKLKVLLYRSYSQ
jgi:hypothetical protein